MTLDFERARKYIKERADINENGCWLWKLRLGRSGYPRCTFWDMDNKLHTSARILSFITYKGGFDRTVQLRNTCGINECVNPEHLVLHTIETVLSNYVMSESGCWNWSGCVNDDGYGIVTINSVTWRTHVLAFHQSNDSQIDSNLLVCHTCDNATCINPAHLFLGTYLVNNRDKIKKGRALYAKGESHYSAKISKDVAMRIKYGKESTKDLMKALSVSATLIRAIRRGETWKHL